MAAPFIKKEEEIDSFNHNHNDEYCSSNINNNNNKRERGRGRARGISIAERRAAKCGFNASNINAAAPSPSPSPPLFTVPPGLSPSALLESPIMLPNAQAQLSPTTGTFQFPSPNHESLKLKLKLGSNGEEVDANNNFIIMPPAAAEQQQQPLGEILQKVEAECFDDSSSNNHNNTSSRNQMMTSSSTLGNNPNIPRSSLQKTNNATVNANVVNNNSKNSEDGFYWRKYGQKHVKGSEYPRSYYKCTNTNCPVTKKVERSHDGHITEIVYKGYHNHPNPVNNNVVNPVITGGDGEGEGEGEGGTLTTSSSNNYVMMNDPINNTFHDHLDFAPHELVDRRNVPSPESVSFNEDDHNINAADHEINGELCEAKKRKRESSSYCFPGDSSSARSTREPKVVVQIESEIDILDDGYRWRKYGQKVVKGNPNPRSYYKCTTPGCPVRKHVERAANDIKSVITTYEGKHNHQVPSTKTGTTTSSITSISSDIVAANLQPLPASATTSSTTKPPPPPLSGPGGKQIQDNLPPLYLDRKPIFNYNELIRSGSSDHLNFGPNSSLYPLPFPPFHSLPYASVFMNSKTYPPASSRLYPIMPMPSSHINHHHHVNVAAGSSATSAMHHYTTTATTTTYAAHHQFQPAETRALKPKEEQIRDEDELYDTCLSIPNQANGTI